MNKKQDSGVARGAELLLKGAVMLQKACPQCNSPLYRIKNNKIYCATCETEVIIIAQNEPIPPEVQKALKKEKTIKQEENSSSSISEINQAEKVLAKKLLLLTKSLEETNDVDEMLKLTEIIDKISETIKRMKK